MIDKDKKRLFREEKRNVKKDGNRSRRRHFQRQLDRDPENAHLNDYNFKFDSSTYLNGMDHDATRRKQDEWEQEMYGQDNEEEREQY